MKYLPLLISLLFPFQAYAAQIVCPVKLDINAAKDGVMTDFGKVAGARGTIAKSEGVIGGQIVKYKTGNNFVNTSLIEGPPEEQGILVPDNENADDNYNWTLVGYGPYFIECQYQNTPYSVYYQITEPVKNCVAQKTKLDGAATQKFVCK